MLLSRCLWFSLSRSRRFLQCLSLKIDEKERIFEEAIIPCCLSLSLVWFKTTQITSVCFWSQDIRTKQHYIQELMNPINCHTLNFNPYFQSKYGFYFCMLDTALKWQSLHVLPWRWCTGVLFGFWVSLLLSLVWPSFRREKKGRGWAGFLHFRCVSSETWDVSKTNRSLAKLNLQLPWEKNISKFLSYFLSNFGIFLCQSTWKHPLGSCDMKLFCHSVGIFGCQSVHSCMYFKLRTKKQRKRYCVSIG